MEEENELNSDEENNDLNIKERQLIILKDLNLIQERSYWEKYILNIFSG